MKNKDDHWFVEILAENSAKIFIGFFIVASIAVLGAIGIYNAYFWGNPIMENREEWGQLGDYFGGILNPIFGFLSVLALLVALVLQTRELKLSRKSLKLSQEELRLSREEQAKSSAALTLQNRSIQKQSFEQTFFAWLGTYRQILQEIVFLENLGRESLKNLWRRELSAECFLWEEGNTLMAAGITSLIDAQKDQYPAISRIALATWERLYKTHEIQLDSFYRVLYRLLKWIDEHPEESLCGEEKWLYISIVRSQLSWIEMVFLFYNGMTTRGEKFKPLIEKYALFDNLTIESDRLLIILRECPMDSVGYNSSAYNSDIARGTKAP